MDRVLLEVDGVVQVPPDQFEPRIGGNVLGENPIRCPARDEYAAAERLAHHRSANPQRTIGAKGEYADEGCTDEQDANQASPRSTCGLSGGFHAIPFVVAMLRCRGFVRQ
ncbi:hypothetical protein [Dyella thiooxydans]|uniref:hypothetical protein n=1 Tax=Dyella thiooxydans TaxID=445710 RepID=UPI001F2E2B7D|nr:hypothetical protein [Dyella thiooxydans]